MSAGLNSVLINSEDIRSLFRRDASGNPVFDNPLTDLPINILEKLRLSESSLRLPHDIRPEEYERVLLTSDIHADLEKFMLILYNNGIIDRYYTTHADNSASPAYKDYITQIDDIINIISDFRVRQHNFLLVIIGDLVDGRRDGDIRDPWGNIEILLHIFIYNLRIKARANGAEVRFTIGNHDWHTIIQTDMFAGSTQEKFYNDYVHTTAKKYFGDNTDRRFVSRNNAVRVSPAFTNRRNCLIFFYLLSPYLIITIGRELACVHGGLHNEYGTMIDDIIQMQNLIDNDINFFLNIETTGETNEYLSSEFGFLWSRFYSHGSKQSVCDNSINGQDRFHLIAVGHCPTDVCNHSGYMQELSNKDRPRCQGNGCVLLGCEDRTGPRLAFVDITMSTSFRGGVSDNGRKNEVLHLIHSSDPRHNGLRYYNTIKRVRSYISTPPEFDIVWEQLQALPPLPISDPNPQTPNSDPQSPNHEVLNMGNINPYSQNTNYPRWLNWEYNHMGGGKKSKKRLHRKKRLRKTRKVLRRK